MIQKPHFQHNRKPIGDYDIILNAPRKKKDWRIRGIKSPKVDWRIAGIPKGIYHG